MEIAVARNQALQQRCGLVKDHGLSSQICHSSTSLFHEQRPSTNIPLIFRYQGKGGIRIAICNTSQLVGDTTHWTGMEKGSEIFPFSAFRF